MIGPPEDELMRVLDQVAHDAQAGAIVPFLGAGVSLGSRVSDYCDFKPTVGWLTEKIQDALKACEDIDPIYEKLLSPSPPLTHLSEIATWILGPEKVVGCVGIRHFTMLNTLPAHRYIARMAREGWIREIITVNYDTCIERAWRATFRHVREATPHWPAVIVTGEEYCQRGRPSRFDHCGPESSLRIYKINGCAQDWEQSNGSDQTASLRIKLTDPQLAHPDTPWKIDLLRDRMRSRRLIYSGFGGEEAQIRFTFLAVDREFDSSSEQDEAYSGPIVHVYDKPTFFQLQLLSRTPRGSTHQPDPRGLVTAENFKDGNKGDQKLEADVFWRVLYRRTMVAALLELLEPSGSFRRRLAREGHPVGSSTLEPMRQWLQCHVRGGHDGWRPFDEVSRDFDMAPSNDAPALEIQAILHTARGCPTRVAVPGVGPRDGSQPWQYYRPLHDDREVLCCLLFLMQAHSHSCETTRDTAAQWGILPVRYLETWRRAILIDSDQARERTWYLGGIPYDQLPCLAVDLGHQGSASIKIRAETDTGLAVYEVPCIAWSDLLPTHHEVRR